MFHRSLRHSCRYTNFEPFQATSMEGPSMLTRTPPLDFHSLSCGTAVPFLLSLIDFRRPRARLSHWECFCAGVGSVPRPASRLPGCPPARVAGAVLVTLHDCKQATLRVAVGLAVRVFAHSPAPVDLYQVRWIALGWPLCRNGLAFPATLWLGLASTTHTFHSIPRS